MTTKRCAFLLVFICVLASSLFSQTVYVTKTGTKYHAEYCRYLSKSKIAISLEDAVGRGYSPCKVCSPALISSKNVRTKSSTIAQQTTKENGSNQCIAITKKGTRCKRIVQPGSQYCWQHQEQAISTKASSNYSEDRTIYTGPRGGRYYYNSKGHKTYLRRK